MIKIPPRAQFLQNLCDLILQVYRPHPIRVAIDGVDAAGKTTLANELTPLIKKRGRRVIRASIDDFHHPRSERYQRGYNSPEGYYYDSFDYQTLLEVLLEPLGPSGDRRYRRAAYDFRKDSPTHDPFRLTAVDAVLLVDGVFLLRPELINSWDFRIFIDVDFEVAVSRAITRDVDLIGSRNSVFRRYRERFIPGQNIYLQSAQPKMHADVVINQNNLEEPELRLVASKKGKQQDED
jgi:uridine kinase